MNWPNIKFGGLIGFVFISGMVTSNNLSRLIGTDPDYDAAWWKIVLSIFLATGAALCAWSILKEES